MDYRGCQQWPKSLLILFPTSNNKIVIVKQNSTPKQQANNVSGIQC